MCLHVCLPPSFVACMRIQLTSNLDFKVAVQEVDQAAKYLLETGSPKVGITGACRRKRHVSREP